MFVLQNLTTTEYVKNYNKSGISWCDSWQDAQDFNDMFFVNRMFLRLKLNHNFKLKLKWKRILIFEGVRGLV
jgi:hypothetical protein